MAQVRQLGLALGEPKVGWGGKRAGAGRKPGKTSVPHGRRPFHEGRFPLHVTYRVVRGLPSLRLRAIAAAIVDGIRGRASRTYRVCHFSVQGNHLHLIVEAGSKASLARGMQGLAIAMARRINAVLGRHGQVFAERYHARELTTPADVRNTLRYVLLNRQKHARPGRGTWIVDDCSSGPWFQGWAWEPYAPDPPPAPVAAATTWLLAIGWRRGGGWIDPREVPGGVGRGPD